MEKQNRSETDQRISKILKQAINANEDLFFDPNCAEITEPDYSFLDAGIKRSKAHPLRRGVRVAILLLVLLTASAGLALMIADGTADGIKSRLDKILYRYDKEILLVTEGNEHSEDTFHSETSIEIDDVKDMDKAKIFLEELYVPYYIPEGYEFVTLTITKKTDGTYWGQYEYTNMEKNFLRLFFTNFFELESLKERVRNAVKVYETKDGNLYVCEDETMRTLVGIMLTEKMACFLNGFLTQEEILNVLQSLEK